MSSADEVLNAIVCTILSFDMVLLARMEITS